MTALGEPATLLDVWERAGRVPVAARGAVLVHGAGLVGELDEALDLDLGRCAALASRAYREDFGETAEAVAVCRTCGELIEAVIPVGDLAGADDPRPGPGRADVPATERVVDEWVVRAVTTRDLLLAARTSDADPTALLTCCVRHRVTGAAPTALPAELLAELEAAAEELTGAGALVSTVTCPACSATVEVGFDAGALLWERVAAAGASLLTEVATLAASFGWGEAQVLALSPARRRAYLALATP